LKDSNGDYKMNITWCTDLEDLCKLAIDAFQNNVQNSN